MSKSVLVMDTPENCCSCYLYGFTLNLHYCRGKLKDIKDISTRPDQCPLKPLPEKMDVGNIDNIYNLNRAVQAVGWNACIDEITGGNVDD